MRIHLPDPTVTALHTGYERLAIEDALNALRLERRASVRRVLLRRLHLRAPAAPDAGHLEPWARTRDADQPAPAVPRQRHA